MAATPTPAVSADPDIDTQSAAAVIQQLRAQGYAVEVEGVSSQATGLLTGCTVTSIDKPAAPTPDPTITTTVYVRVACPLRHG